MILEQLHTERLVYFCEMFCWDFEVLHIIPIDESRENIILKVEINELHSN